MMVAAKLGIATALAAGAACAAVLTHTHHINDEAQIARQIRTHLPAEKDYSAVALPTTPPPGDAFVQTSHNANPAHSEQVVMFQYRPFTLYACIMPGSAAAGACAGEGRTLLRTVPNEHGLTVYTIATKFLNDPSRTSPDLFAQVSGYVAHAEFTTTPPWVKPYAATQLRKRY